MRTGVPLTALSFDRVMRTGVPLTVLGFGGVMRTGVPLTSQMCHSFMCNVQVEYSELSCFLLAFVQ